MYKELSFNISKSWKPIRPKVFNRDFKKSSASDNYLKVIINTTSLFSNYLFI